MFNRRLTDSQHAGKKPFDCRSKLSELLQRSTKGASSFHLLTTNLRLTCCPPAVHTSTRALGRSDKRCPHPFVTGEKPARERGRSRTGACRYATPMHFGRLLMVGVPWKAKVKHSRRSAFSGGRAGGRRAPGPPSAYLGRNGGGGLLHIY